MKFMVTFVPIFAAFMVGMYNMYWYYDPSVRNNVETMHEQDIVTRAEKGFGKSVWLYNGAFIPPHAVSF